MRFKFNFLSCLLSGFLAASPVLAHGQADPFPAKLEEDLSAGTSATYLLDFKGARKHFEHAIELDPGHPAAYFFQLMGYWY